MCSHTTYRLIRFLRARILLQRIARLGSTLPEVIVTCANPVVDDGIFCQKAGHGIVGDDAGAGFYEDVLDDGMADDLANVDLW